VERNPRPTPAAGRNDHWHAVLVPLGLLALAALLGTQPLRPRTPDGTRRTAPPWATDPTPVRHAKLAPEISLAGFTYRCSDCHKLFESPAETERTLTQHREIQLKHGINTRCFNCHHRENRDAFADEAGREIPYDQPQLVCAKCHGPVYRDWLHGAHGRTNGHWNPAAGPQERRRCIECHDPHQPPFPPMRPAPGPHTLRMGDQTLPAEAHGIEDPLRVFHRTDAGHAVPPASSAGSEEHR